MAKTKKKRDPFSLFTLVVSIGAVGAAVWMGLTALELRSLHRENTRLENDLGDAEQYLETHKLLLARNEMQDTSGLPHDNLALDVHIRKCAKLAHAAFHPSGHPQLKSKANEPQRAMARVNDRGDKIVAFLQQLESLRTLSYIYDLTATRQAGRTGDRPGPAKWDVTVHMKAPDVKPTSPVPGK